MAWMEAATVVYLRTLVDRLDPYQPLPLPFFGDLLRSRGIELVCGDPLASFEGDAERVERVLTESGRSLDADLVVMGTGAVPDVMLARKAGLAGTLSKPGPYTVFAPTNAAFKRLPPATLAAVKSDPSLLKKVLLYHVVKGDVRAAQVVKLDGKSARTLEGQRVTIDVRGGSVFLNNTVRVTKTDVLATNGVIHVIDKVLVPKS